jgi:hypothetical protein
MVILGLFIYIKLYLVKLNYTRLNLAKASYLG